MSNTASSDMRGLLVTGTDTGVGKTYVAALILRQLCEAGIRAGAYKPVCTGAVQQGDGSWRWDDIERLARDVNWRASGAGYAGPDARVVDVICPQRLRAPLAPPLAARKEDKTVDGSLLVQGIEGWRGFADAVVIEGVGGWLCPVTNDWTVADLAVVWNVPAVIVARRGLGTINHTLLTVESIRHRNVPIAGIVLNEPQPLLDDPSAEHNAGEIERRTGVPILGEIHHGERPELRRAGQPVRIAWWELMGGLSVVSGQ